MILGTLILLIVIMKVHSFYWISLLVLLCVYSCNDNVAIDKEGEDNKQESYKDRIPQPIFDEAPEFVELYWKAWELAKGRIKYQAGVFQSPYMDENLWDDTIWIWDTAFMVLFCRYAPDVFPGIESLDNFYEPILNKKSTSLKIQHPDNPPIMAWAEYEYYKMTGDKERLKRVLEDEKFLQRYFEWFDSLKRDTQLHFSHAWIALEKTEIGYKWGWVQSGMDNTPRGRGCKGDLMWMDALSQQALSALCIQNLAKELGNSSVADEFSAHYDECKRLLNELYWDNNDGFYYDIDDSNRNFIKVRTPAVYWAMLAELADDEQAARLADYASNPQEFGGEYPWPSLSYSDKDCNKEIGDYWRGSVWLPLAYMATKALEKYGYYDIAYENSYKLLTNMYNTYSQYIPHTIWECYSPSAPRPGERQNGQTRELVREDFCGWSALGPISIFLENVLGFHYINANEKIVEWNKRGDKRQGIINLHFGDIVTDIIAENDSVFVKSNSSYTLIVNEKKFDVMPGNQNLNIQ